MIDDALAEVRRDANRAAVVINGGSYIPLDAHADIVAFVAAKYAAIGTYAIERRDDTLNPQVFASYGEALRHFAPHFDRRIVRYIPASKE